MPGSNFVTIPDDRSSNSHTTIIITMKSLGYDQDGRQLNNTSATVA
jgi:hypothetical protein